MLHLTLGELDAALDWANWTLNMNSSVFTAERANYYRCLINSIELFLDKSRQPEQYRMVFEKMYGQRAVEIAWQAVQGGNPFYDLLADDEHLHQFQAHQKLLQAYEKLQKAKRENWK